MTDDLNLNAGPTSRSVSLFASEIDNCAANRSFEKIYTEEFVTGILCAHGSLAVNWVVLNCDLSSYSGVPTLTIKCASKLLTDSLDRLSSRLSSVRRRKLLDIHIRCHESCLARHFRDERVDNYYEYSSFPLLTANLVPFTHELFVFNNYQ